MNILHVILKNVIHLLSLTKISKKKIINEYNRQKLRELTRPESFSTNKINQTPPLTPNFNKQNNTKCTTCRKIGHNAESCRVKIKKC